MFHTEMSFRLINIYVKMIVSFQVISFLKVVIGCTICFLCVCYAEILIISRCISCVFFVLDCNSDITFYSGSCVWCFFLLTYLVTCCKQINLYTNLLDYSFIWNSYNVAGYYNSIGFSILRNFYNKQFQVYILTSTFVDAYRKTISKFIFFYILIFNNSPILFLQLRNLYIFYFIFYLNWTVLDWKLIRLS